MPFIYDETNIEWPADDDEWEPPPPHADQFIYLSPPEYGGASEPVRFSVAELQAAEPASAPGEPPHEERGQRAFAFAVAELRKAGVRRLYCRYDGGHDEGFSWLDRAEMTDGARLDADALFRRLYETGLLDRIYAAGMMRSRVAISRHFSDQQRLVHFLDGDLFSEWASMLLGGRGYGTGQMSMYGAFTVDLEACTITDDRNADVVVKHIGIAT
jgi:hypothetical protein